MSYMFSGASVFNDGTGMGHPLNISPPHLTGTLAWNVGQVTKMGDTVYLTGTVGREYRVRYGRHVSG